MNQPSTTPPVEVDGLEYDALATDSLLAKADQTFERHGPKATMPIAAVTVARHLRPITTLQSENAALRERVAELEAALFWYGIRARALTDHDPDTENLARRELRGDWGDMARAALSTDTAKEGA